MDEEGIDYSIYSLEEIKGVINGLSKNYISHEQVLWLLKTLLEESSETQYIFSVLPQVINCTNDDFSALFPVFKKLFKQDSSVAHLILPIISEFDLDIANKTNLHELLLEFSHLIENKYLPQLISNTILSIPNKPSEELYQTISYIVVNHAVPEVFHALISSIRPHVQFFFKCLSSTKQWSFFDFVILISSIIRPSLRSKVSELFWTSIINRQLTFDQLCDFFSPEMAPNISHMFSSIMTFLKTILLNPPDYVYNAVLLGMSKFIHRIYDVFPDEVFDLTNMLIMQAAGSSFASSVAIHTLLEIDTQYITKSLVMIDEIISQSPHSEYKTISSLCSIMSRAMTENSQPVLYISIQKRLMHSSNVLVHAAILLALHLTKTGAADSDEVFMWVMRAMNNKALSLKPEFLLSVIDLIRIRDYIPFINVVTPFVLRLFKSFRLTSVVSNKTSLVAYEKIDLAISTSELGSPSQAELAGEIIILMHEILNVDRQLLEDEVEDLLLEYYDTFLLDFKKTGFIVPKAYLDYIDANREEPVKLGPYVRKLLSIKAICYPLISAFKFGGSFVNQCFSMIDSIDQILKIKEYRGNRKDSETDYAQLSPSFIFQTFNDSSIDFDNVELYPMNLIINSLYRIFVLDNNNHRFYYDDKFEYLSEVMNNDIAKKIILLTSRFLTLASTVDKSQEQELISDSVKTAAKAIEFLNLCFCIDTFGISYLDDILPLISETKDVGVGCRLIFAGFFMGESMESLVNVARCSIETNQYMCDLTDRIIRYPLNIEHIEEIVHPRNPGSSWRLIIYLSLITNDSSKFFETCESLISRIQTKKLGDHNAFVLADVVAKRMFDFTDDYPNNFSNIFTLCCDVIPLIASDDPVAMSTLSNLLKNVMEMHTTHPDLSLDYKNISKLVNIKNPTFDTKGRKNAQKDFTDINVLCEKLRRINSSDEETEGEQTIPASIAKKLFGSESDSYDGDFKGSEYENEEEEDFI